MSSPSGMGLLRYIANATAARGFDGLDDQATRRRPAAARTGDHFRHRRASPLPRQDSPYDSDNGDSPSDLSQNSEIEDSDYEPSPSSSNDEMSSSQGDFETLPRNFAVLPKSPSTTKSHSGVAQCKKVPKHDEKQDFCSHGDVQDQATVRPDSQKTHGNLQLRQPAASSHSAVQQAARVRSIAGGSDVIDQHVQNTLVEKFQPVYAKHKLKPHDKSQCNVLLGLVNYRGGTGESAGRWGIYASTSDDCRRHSCRDKCWEFIKLLTDLIRQHKPEFTYTSVSVNKRTLEDAHDEYAHLDLANAPNPGTCLVAFGVFSGGELWIEDPLSNQEPRTSLEQPKHPPQKAFGRRLPVRGQFQVVNTTEILHGPCRHNGGDRYIAVFFTPSYVVDGVCKHQAKAVKSFTILNNLGFNLPFQEDISPMLASTFKTRQAASPERESSSSGRDGKRRKRQNLLMPTAHSQTAINAEFVAEVAEVAGVCCRARVDNDSRNCKRCPIRMEYCWQHAQMYLC